MELAVHSGGAYTSGGAKTTGDKKHPDLTSYQIRVLIWQSRRARRSRGLSELDFHGVEQIFTVVAVRESDAEILSWYRERRIALICHYTNPLFAQYMFASRHEFDTPRIASHPIPVQTSADFAVGLCNSIRHSNLCDTFRHRFQYPASASHLQLRDPIYTYQRDIEELSGYPDQTRLYRKGAPNPKPALDLQLWDIVARTDIAQLQHGRVPAAI